MNKENKLFNKVKRLIKRLGMPRWLHHYGPKKYEFLHHLTALLIRAMCKLSYRAVKKLLDLLSIKCPSKSALQYTAKKLNAGFWKKVFAITCTKPYLVAVDSTGLSRNNPSYYYLKRIDAKIPRVPVKLSVSFDTKNKKFCSAKVRVLPAHDIKDVKTLLKNNKPKMLVADKAYDANWLHNHCHELGIKTHIPLRKWSKPRHKNTSLRIKSLKTFNIRTYHRRELVESAFSSLKRKYGSSVNSKKVRTIKTEVYCRLLCHNLFSYAKRLLGQSPFHGKVNIVTIHPITDEKILNRVISGRWTKNE